MMNKILHTMFYGSAKARVFLWSIVIMGLAAVLFGVLAAVLGSLRSEREPLSARCRHL